jgi:hypothetical protein
MGANGPVWSAFDVLGLIGRGLYPTTARADESLLDAAPGTYVESSGARQTRPPRLVITRDRDALVCTASDRELNGRLGYLGDDQFFYRVNPNQRVHFLRNSAERVTAAEISHVQFPNFYVRLRRLR